MNSSWKTKFIWFLALLCLALLATRFLVQRQSSLFPFSRKSKVDLSQRKEDFKIDIYKTLFDFGIRVHWITGDNRTKTVHVPADLAMVEPYAAVVVTTRKHGGFLLRAETNPFQDRMILDVGMGDESILQLTFIEDPELRRAAGKIAIVIDDFGYSRNAVIESFLNLPQEISYSIIPGLQYSHTIADAVQERNRTAMLHLPMEPKNGTFDPDDYDFAIMTQMSETEIRERVQAAIKALPQAEGLNNHMGSRATENEEVLAILMEEVKKADLFFLDSRTSRSSKAFSWAKKTEVPSQVNNTFLDAILEKELIRKQVHLLAELASKNGSAIGIGHPEQLTLEVLQEELPDLHRRGFEFVSVSKLVE